MRLLVRKPRTSTDGIVQEDIMPRLKQAARWLYEITLSALLAMMIMVEETSREGSSLPGWISRPLRPLFPFLERLRPWTDTYLWRRLDFYLLWLFLALIMLIVVRLCGLTVLLRRILKLINGILIVAGFPLYCLEYSYGLMPPHANTRWLLLETAVAGAFAVLYLCRRLPAKAHWSIAVLAVHFGLWAWISQEARDNELRMFCLLLSACSCLGWSLWVRLPDQRA
jgi:hypothetical protein